MGEFMVLRSPIENKFDGRGGARLSVAVRRYCFVAIMTLALGPQEFAQTNVVVIRPR
jgi:hypothetical protein